MPEHIVAIPARDERARIGGCLEALFRQSSDRPLGVFLLLNNCVDGTADLVRATPPPPHVELRCREVDLPAHLCSAGVARCLAMQGAAAWAGPHGVLLTTDADGAVAPSWLEGNIAALGRADAVAGRAVIDAEEARAIPQSLHDADALECQLGDLQDEIASLLDPDPADPWPRHAENSGASLAVTAAAYARVGGMTPVPSGEDRAFVHSLRRIDARVRHAPEVWVRVSGRTLGRAAGGMAETIARRMVRPDPFLDDRLEPLAAALRRARLRRMARLWFRHRIGDVDLLACRLRVADAASVLRAGRWFGTAWDELERRSAVLARTLVPANAVAVEIARATRARDALRSSVSLDAAAPDESRVVLTA